MNFVKRNKLTIIVIIIFTVLLLVGVRVKDAFFPEEGEAIYGNRLETVKKTKIDEETKAKVKKQFAEDAVSETTVRVSGKTVEIIITVNDDVSRDTAKSYGSKALEPFTEEQKQLYDFQIFIKKNIETTDFPIIGYVQKNANNISWTKDR